MAGRSLTLYVGVTGDLRGRVLAHKVHCYPKGFTAKYKIERLVYFEVLGEVANAIAREKQIKNWRRDKKIALIKTMNPTWVDLAADWYTRAALSGQLERGATESF